MILFNANRDSIRKPYDVRRKIFNKCALGCGIGRGGTGGKLSTTGTLTVHKLRY